jgi:hypothetical protein
VNAALRGTIAARWVGDALGMPTFGVHQTDCPEMERLRNNLLDVDEILFEEVAASPSPTEWPGLQEEWRGRFWFPTDGRVEPSRNPWLVCNDGRAGRPILDSFGEGATNGDVAVYQGDTRFV